MLYPLFPRNSIRIDLRIVAFEDTAWASSMHWVINTHCMMSFDPGFELNILLF